MKPNFKAVVINGIAISFSLAFLIRKNLRGRRKSEQLLSDFYRVADEFNFLISKQERLGNRVIALDETNNRLLFFAAKTDKREGYLIQLDKLKSSVVNREFAVTKSASGYHATMATDVDKIVLQLNYKNGALPLDLPFYEKGSDSFFMMRQRAVKAIEWQSLISNRLTKTSVAKHLLKRKSIFN